MFFHLFYLLFLLVCNKNTPTCERNAIETDKKENIQEIFIKEVRSSEFRLPFSITSDLKIMHHILILVAYMYLYLTMPKTNYWLSLLK